MRAPLYTIFLTCGVDEPPLRRLLPGGVSDVAAAHLGVVGRVRHDGAHVALLEGGAPGGLNLKGNKMKFEQIFRLKCYDFSSLIRETQMKEPVCCRPSVS